MNVYTSIKEKPAPVAEYITIREACEICRASEKRLRNAIDAGEISHIMLQDRGKRHGSGSKLVKHILAAELEAWLEKTGAHAKGA